jgi:hypothetical protein
MVLRSPEWDLNDERSSRRMVTITPVQTGAVSVLTVSGEIDIASGPRLRAALAVLVDAHEHAMQRGIALKIVIDGPGSPVARAFQAAAIHEHLDVQFGPTE